MKEKDWNIYKHCAHCKKPLTEHDEIHWGLECDKKFEPFEDELTEGGNGE